MSLKMKRAARAVAGAGLGAAALLAGCAFMDLAWSNLISREDLARSNNIIGAATCREMSHHTFQSWLLFNPKNLRTYYIRSDCFMKVAVRERDEDLCREVVERRSLWFDGSGVSEHACREAVRKRKDADAREAVAGDPHRIAGVTVQRSPEEDQAEVRVRTEGSLPGTYELSYTLLNEEGVPVGRLDAVKTPLGTTGTDSLGTMVYRRDVRKLLGPAYRPGAGYTLEVRLEWIGDKEPAAPGRALSPPEPSVARKRISFNR